MEENAGEVWMEMIALLALCGLNKGEPHAHWRGGQSADEKRRLGVCT
ncbi:MAG: hypothetical protein RR865_15055 [Clostridia bacterium]